jgi:hypothetical protein
MSAKNNFWVVVRGEKPGLYKTWQEAEVQVNGFPSNMHQAFEDEQDAISYYHNGYLRESGHTNLPEKEGEKVLFTLNPSRPKTTLNPNRRRRSSRGKSSIGSVSHATRPSTQSTGLWGELQFKYWIEWKIRQQGILQNYKFKWHNENGETSKSPDFTLTKSRSETIYCEIKATKNERMTRIGNLLTKAERKFAKSLKKNEIYKVYGVTGVGSESPCIVQLPTFSGFKAIKRRKSETKLYSDYHLQSPQIILPQMDCTQVTVLLRVGKRIKIELPDNRGIFWARKKYFKIESGSERD